MSWPLRGREAAVTIEAMESRDLEKVLSRFVVPVEPAGGSAGSVVAAVVWVEHALSRLRIPTLKDAMIVD